MSTEKQLKDLGERKIVQEMIVKNFNEVKNNFDDAALIPIDKDYDSLVISTDPCPKPVVCMIDKMDYYQYGKMSVLINVSDMAAMGAVPSGILISTMMPEDMLVKEYMEFLNGLKDACVEYQCPLIGGNIKESDQFSVTGTIFGYVNAIQALKRDGAKEGDNICVVGEMGYFWSAVLQKVQDLSLGNTDNEKLYKALYQPRAKMREGQLLLHAGCVTACMDSSDGIVACLKEIALSSNVDIVVKDQNIVPDKVVKDIAMMVEIDYQNLMLSWGDWNLVIAVNPQKTEEIKQLMKKHRIPFSVIGQVKKGAGHVFFEKVNSISEIDRTLSSERFNQDSFLQHGIEPYFNLLKTYKL